MYKASPAILIIHEESRRQCPLILRQSTVDPSSASYRWPRIQSGRPARPPIHLDSLGDLSVRPPLVNCCRDPWLCEGQPSEVTVAWIQTVRDS